MKIVIIDDDTNTTKFNSRVELLELEGISVRAFAEIEEALLFLSNLDNKIDALVLDLCMPSAIFEQEETHFGRLTGIVLFKEIRSIRPLLPIIFCSVLDKGVIPDIILRSENVDYINKPLLTSELVNKIKSAMVKF